MGEKKKKEAKEKPLEKMTSKELREIAMGIPGITGAHGMNKEELVSEIKRSRGIVEEKTGKKDDSVREIKQKIKEFRVKRLGFKEAGNKKLVDLYRRKIGHLKKKTRKAA